jgi:hypothetical protein
MTALILAAALIGDARQISLQASPVSWGDDCFSLIAAPASLARIEAACSGLSFRSGGGGRSFEGAWGGPLGPIHAGAAAGTGTFGSDSTFAALGAALVITGTPQGFLEGFFGPSITVGAALDASWTDGDSASIAASASVQFSVFPTFAIGAAIRDAGVVVAEGREYDACGDYGATYIFNRDFRAMFSYSRSRAKLGGQLDISRAIAVRAGTDGTSWAAGAGLSLGRITLDLSAAFDDSSVSSSGSVLLDIGGDEPWN